MADLTQLTQKTFTDAAVRIAHRIKNSTKTDLEGLKRDELDAFLTEFADTLPDGDLMLDREFHPALRGELSKEVTGRVLRSAAAEIIEINGEENSRQYEIERRLGFLPTLYREIESKRERLDRVMEDVRKDDWNWGSKVDKIHELKAEIRARQKLIHDIEILCGNLSLTEAAEHAIHRLREDVLRNATRNVNSTSRGAVQAELEENRATADLLQHGFGRWCPEPVDHSDKLPKS